MKPIIYLIFAAPIPYIAVGYLYPRCRSKGRDCHGPAISRWTGPFRHRAHSVRAVGRVVLREDRTAGLYLHDGEFRALREDAATRPAPAHAGGPAHRPPHQHE